MRTICFILIQLITSSLYSQEISLETLKSIGLPYDENTKKVTFTDVVEVSNTNKEKLFSLVKSELTLLLKNNKMTTLIDDSELGRLIVQGTYELVIKKGANNTFYNVIFTLLVDFKDNKFKYLLTDYYLYNAEEPLYKSKSIEWIDGVSTSNLKENKIKLYPFEIFFSNDNNRDDNRKIFPSFKNVNSELINNIKKISGIDNSDW